MPKEQYPKLRSDFCGMTFNSPLVLLSGCVGFGDDYTRVKGFSHSDVGAVCLKGTTLKPRLGNSPHRIAETAHGVLNSIGLQNPGVVALIKDILPRLDFSQTRFIANISGTTVSEYAEIARRLNDTEIDAIEINVSCPNVQKGGLSFGNDPQMSAQVVAACRHVTDKPLITKLSPNQTDIVANARRCLEAGSDAFAAINTVVGMAVDIRKRQPSLGSNHGGLSGAAIKPIALYSVFRIHELCKPYGVPIIGQGGAVMPEDAIEFLIAGASAVGVGTGLFYDPLICSKMNHAINAYLDENGYAEVADLVGTLELHPAHGPDQEAIA